MTATLGQAARTPACTVISFGYGHAESPTVDVTVDARLYRNPHHDPAMRYLTGLDEAVHLHVLGTPGVREAIADAAASAVELARLQPEIRVGVGCVGGRHRSVSMAIEIAASLTAAGVTTQVEHRDVDKPVLTSPAHRVGDAK